MITFFGNRRGMSDSEAIANCVEGLNRVKKIAEDNDVTICVELLNSKVDHKDYQGDHTAFGVEVVKAVASPRVKLLYDIYHMQIMEGDIIRTIRDNKDYIAHFHTGGVPGRHELDDTQELNWRDGARRDCGYRTTRAMWRTSSCRRATRSRRFAKRWCSVTSNRLARVLALSLVAAAACTHPTQRVTAPKPGAAAANSPDRREWIQLFNGKNLDGWVPKIKGYELGENFGDTFRVEDGILKVSYDKYTTFDERFGHLFYRQKFSHYILAAEYRFVGEQVPGGPDWALRNNGLMLHSQAPETMGKDQDFPISIEAQLLGGGPSGERPTLNVCTPGTEIFQNGVMVKGHCKNSTSATYRGDQWVRVEVEVLGADHIRHMIDGRTVLEYRFAADWRRQRLRLQTRGEDRWQAALRGLHHHPGRKPSNRVSQDRAAEPVRVHET